MTAKAANVHEGVFDGRPCPAQAGMTMLIDPCTDPATGFHRPPDEVFRLD